MKRYIRAAVVPLQDAQGADALSVYYDVACDPKTSSRELAELIKIPWECLKGQVTAHPNCTPDILAVLSQDESFFVRGQVAENPNTPVEILRRLSRDRKSIVRWHLVQNPNAPIDVLEKLSNDRDVDVRRAAKQTLDELGAK